MASPAVSAFEQLCGFTRETAVLESVQGVLEWDERTYMPVDAGEYRAEQLAYLSRLIHERRIDSRLGGWLDELETGPLAADPWR